MEELQFVYSEKVTKFVHTDKSKVEILQNFVAFQNVRTVTLPHFEFLSLHIDV